MSKRRERDGIEVGEIERQKQEDGGKRGGEGSRFMKLLECNLEAEITVSLSKV